MTETLSPIDVSVTVSDSDRQKYTSVISEYTIASYRESLWQSEDKHRSITYRIPSARLVLPECPAGTRSQGCQYCGPCWASERTTIRSAETSHCAGDSYADWLLGMCGVCACVCIMRWFMMKREGDHELEIILWRKRSELEIRWLVSSNYPPTN